MDPVSTTETKKKFFDTKEGTWGLGIMVLAVIACAVFFPAIMAGVTAMFTLLGAGIAYGILAVLAFIILDGLFNSGWLWLRYKVFCKKLRLAIIDESPLTILKVWREKAEERKKQIRDAKDTVKAQEQSIGQKVTKFKGDFERFKSQAANCEGRADRQAEFRSAAGNMMKAAEMLKKSAERLALVKNQYARIDMAYKDLEVMMKDMAYEEECLVADYEMSGALDRAWGVIRSVFKGEDEWDQIREEAIESINRKYSERMGRVESAIDDCQGKFDEISLEREVRESDGIAMFNQLKNMSSDQLLSAPVASPTIGYTPSTPIATPVSSSYGAILK